MKTYTEYEPADINLGEGMDPIHSFLMTEVLIVAITGFKPRDGDPADDPTFPLKRIVAGFLNHAQQAGVTIVKSELPAAFTAEPVVPA